MDVEKFNRSVNLGINAEDMLEMLKDRYPNQKFNKNIEPYIFRQNEKFKKGIRSLFRNYIPWDVKQVSIIKSELDWNGDIVEGIPQEYDYENRMHNARSKDYIRFLNAAMVELHILCPLMLETIE